MAAFTTTAVERFIKSGVPMGKPHASLRDGRGLCLRLLPSGAASWQFVYRLRGAGRSSTQKTVTIGAWPALDLRKAAEEARRLAGEVAAGRDPRADINETKRRERAMVLAALDDYEAWIKGRQLRATGQTMSALRRGLGHLLQRDVAQLDRVALIDAIERIERSGRPGAAREFRKHLRTFLNRQLSQGRIAIDPLAGYRMPAATKEDMLAAEEHGKALTEAEIAVLWRVATGIGGPFGGLVKMGLVTGLRRGELAAMRWDWIDRQGLRITVPGRVMKNGRDHALPITSLIAQLLDETPNRGGGLVFPSERRLGGATPMSGWSKLMTRLREASAVAGVGLHDLRRTYRSILADLGVREEIAEAMIAHRRSGLVARYNRAELWEQRREASEKLDIWLRGVVSRVEGDQAPNVVPISRPGKPADALRPLGSVIPLRELGTPTGGDPGPAR
jgi:integrase